MSVSRKRVSAQAANTSKGTAKKAKTKKVKTKETEGIEAPQDSFAGSDSQSTYGGTLAAPSNEQVNKGGLSPSAVGGALAIRCGAIQPTRCTLNVDKTRQLLGWVKDVEATHNDAFKCAAALATRLGATPKADGSTELGFWVPELEW